MAKQIVSGIGGVFFRAKDPLALSKWYEENFGISAISESNPEPWSQQAGYTVFSPFDAATDYYPAEQQVMLNFRVDDIDAFIEQLKENDVRIDEKRQDEAYGRFAWVYDLEGNKVELWQPILPAE